METLTLFANPYQFDARGFYFSTPEEYAAKYQAAYKAAMVEEYSFEYIDGDDEQFQFSKLVRLDQCNVGEWFEQLAEFETMGELEQVAIKYLIDCCGYSYPDAIAKYSDVIVFEGSARDYAYDYIADCTDIEQTMGALSAYFDYDSFARDCLSAGDWTEYGDYLIVGE